MGCFIIQLCQTTKIPTPKKPTKHTPICIMLCFFIFSRTCGKFPSNKKSRPSSKKLPTPANPHEHLNPKNLTSPPLISLFPSIPIPLGCSHISTLQFSIEMFFEATGLRLSFSTHQGRNEHTLSKTSQP